MRGAQPVHDHGTHTAYMFIKGHNFINLITVSGLLGRQDYTVLPASPEEERLAANLKEIELLPHLRQLKDLECRTIVNPDHPMATKARELGLSERLSLSHHAAHSDDEEQESQDTVPLRRLTTCLRIECHMLPDTWTSC